MILFFLCSAAFLFPYLVSRLLTPKLIHLAFQTHLLDHQEGRKKHKKPTPFFGGVAVFIAFWSVIFVGFFLSFLFNGYFDSLGQVPIILKNSLPWVPKIFGVFLGSTLVLIMGLWDDRFDLSPLIKFIGQGIAALILLGIGLQVNLVQPWGMFGYFVTFVWIVLLMNAFNFIDSIDGHCTGVALISLVMFFCLTLLVEQAAVSLLVLAFTGSLFGFFRYNVKPARCFLGDNGSLFIGYMMSVITLLCRYNASPHSTLSPLIPILMFGVPIYDTLSVIAVRLFRGIPPWRGDRNHFAHRLVKIGMGEKNAALFSYFIALTLGLVGILTTQVTTFVGSFIISALFISIISIVALLEYYVTLRLSLIEKFAASKKRRKEDLQSFENGED